MKTSRNLGLVLALAIPQALASARPSLAAEEPQTVPPSAAKVQQPGAVGGPYALQIVDGTILEKGVKVPATVGHVMDALREMYPRVNIVASPEVTDLTLADMKLRPAEVEETLEALRVASGERFDWRRNDQQPAAIDPTTGVPVPPRPVKEPSLYLLTVNPNTSSARAKREVEVFNLSGYLTSGITHAGKQANDEAAIDQGLKTVQDIIKQTLAAVYYQEGTRLDYQFHAGANLLIVIGPRDEIEVARKVIEALPGQPTSVSARFRPEAASPALGADLTEKQREAFMRRYGLTPQRPQPNAGESPNPENSNKK
jgi:hypothetical protein